MKSFTYELKEVIGKGSFGTVYRGITNTGDEIALKMVRINNSVMKSMISREIAVLSQLNHPNILKFLDSKIENEDKYWIATEYCEGGDLEQYIEKSASIKKETILFWFKELLSALSYLQEQNKMHRDLKPANFYLNSKDVNKANIKIGDFGFAKTLSGNLCESKLGTPLYMAPELLNGGKYDSKADVWSLGCIIYELIEGEPLYNARSIGELINLQKEIPSFSDKFTDDEKNVILAMVQYDSNFRPDFTQLYNCQFTQSIRRVFDQPNVSISRMCVQRDFMNKLLVNIDIKVRNIIKLYNSLSLAEHKDCLAWFFAKYCNRIIADVEDKIKKLLTPAPNEILYNFDMAKEKHNTFMSENRIDLKVSNLNESTINEFIAKLMETVFELDQELQYLYVEVGMSFDRTNELLYEFYDMNRPPEIN